MVEVVLADTKNGIEFTHRFVVSSPQAMGWLGARLSGVLTSDVGDEGPAFANRQVKLGFGTGSYPLPILC